jgi:hypothetical protein
MLASLSATRSSLAVLLSLTASVLLVSLRAWSRSSRALLTQLISILLDSAIVIFILLFLALVVIRFKSLA